MRVGVIMALFVSLPENLHVYALSKVSFIKLLFPAVWVTLVWGLAGMMIGMIYGSSPVKQTEETAGSVRLEAKLSMREGEHECQNP